jgi:hypothetical protein
MSALEQIDFQSLLQQDITQFMQFWAEQGMPPDQCQENAGQLYNMGGIAVQQLIQMPQIQIENAPQPVDVTPELAEQIVKLFVAGLQSTYLQATEIIQNTALFVFEQSKNMAVAMVAQPPDQAEQMFQWIAQSASEAFSHYLGEMEKERGPLIGMASGGAPDPILSNESSMPAPMAETPQPDLTIPTVEQAQQAESMPAPESLGLPAEPMPSLPEESSQPAPVQADGNALYRQVALGLILSSTPNHKQAYIQQFCDPGDLQIAQHYQELANIPPNLDMTELVKTIKVVKRTLKERMAKAPKRPSDYRRRIAKMTSVIPEAHMRTVFQNEREGLKTYLNDFYAAPTDSRPNTQTGLPLGVMESLIRYLKRRFPNEMAELKAHGETRP